MQAIHVTADRRKAWNAFVAQSPYFALLQSWEWGQFKEKLGWKAFRIAVENHGQILAAAQILIKPAPLGLASIAYVPRGPVGNWLDKEIVSRLLSELHRVARRHRAIFLKIEPPLLNDPLAGQKLQQFHFRPSSYTNQPRATITLDLTQSLDDILKQMRKKTRQYIRHAARQNIVVRQGDCNDLPAFYELVQITGRRGVFSPRTRDYYQREWQAFVHNDRAVLFMAYYQDQLLASRMAFYLGNHAAEFHAGSSNMFKNLRPNYLLVWEAIKWAKAQGCDTYDLWGIPDQVGQAAYEGQELPTLDRTDNLWGVYRFKSGFSKNIVFYIGAYDYVYSPRLYALITNRLFDKDRLDRIATRMDSLRST